jgi:hypothetical protein
MRRCTRLSCSGPPAMTASIGEHVRASFTPLMSCLSAKRLEMTFFCARCDWCGNWHLI